MQAWLAEVNGQHYTLQLLSISLDESEYVYSVLRQLQQAGLADKTYACVFENSNQGYWKVVYGDFATASQAGAFIADLPSSVRSNGPFVQRIGRLDCSA